MMRFSAFIALAFIIAAATATHENATSDGVTFKGNFTFAMAIDAESFQYIFAEDEANATIANDNEAKEPKAYQMVRLYAIPCLE